MNPQVINLMSKKWFVPTVTGIVSFGTGVATGYILGKRRGDVFEINFDAEAISDIVDRVEDPNQGTLFSASADLTNLENVSFLYGSDVLVNEYELADPNYNIHVEFYDPIAWEDDEEAELMIEEDELLEAIEEQIHLDEITNDGLFVPEIVNVFGTSESQWNYEDELAVRDGEKPYVIHADEYFADEAGCDQETVTYYAGDDIMANEKEVPMYDYESAMGPLKFGHGSKDPSVVYIRNEMLAKEWEVLLHTGRFDIEVAGVDVEDAYAAQDLKHSMSRRFRDE